MNKILMVLCFFSCIISAVGCAQVSDPAKEMYRVEATKVAANRESSVYKQYATVSAAQAKAENERIQMIGTAVAQIAAAVVSGDVAGDDDGMKKIPYDIGEDGKIVDTTTKNGKVLMDSGARREVGRDALAAFTAAISSPPQQIQLPNADAKKK